MKFISICVMIGRPTFPHLIEATKEIKNNEWDAAGFEFWTYKWEGMTFLIFIIQENKKNLIIRILNKSNHAMVEGAPTLFSKNPIKMDLIGIAKELSEKDIVKEYNIEVYTGTEHESYASRCVI
jgi:hypothetical protein